MRDQSDEMGRFRTFKARLGRRETRYVPDKQAKKVQ